MKLQLLYAFAIATSSLFGANILLNPGFENLPLGSTFNVLDAGNTTDLPAWTVTGTSCHTINNCVLVLRSDYTEPSNVGTILFQPHGGNQSIDLTGGGNTGDGGVEQIVNLTVGTLYNLSFWLGNQDDRASNYTAPSQVQVFVNGVSQGIFTNSSSTNNQLNWAQFSLSFTPTVTSNTIRFQNATASSDSEAGLDDVSLDVAGSAVPEPSSVILAASALCVLGLVVRSRFRV